MLPHVGKPGQGKSHDEAGRGETDDAAAITFLQAHGGFRDGQASGGEGIGGLLAGHSEVAQANADVDQLHPGAQDEHLQALEDGGLEIGCQDQPVAALLAVDDEVGQHAALGGTPGGKLGLPILEMVEVVGELGVQEGPRVFAGGFDAGKLQQGDDDRAAGGSGKFGGRVAKMQESCRIGSKNGTLPGQEGWPGMGEGIHCGLARKGGLGCVWAIITPVPGQAGRPRLQFDLVSP